MKAGEVVDYRVEVRDTGQAPIAGATFVDDLSDVIDNATWNGDAKASIGTATCATRSCSTDTPLLPVPKPPPQPIAVTGFPMLPLTILAGVLLLTGAILVLTTRRRRTE